MILLKTICGEKGRYIRQYHAYDCLSEIETIAHVENIDKLEVYEKSDTMTDHLRFLLKKKEKERDKFTDGSSNI